MDTTRNFVEDIFFYASRMKSFEREDWHVYFAWVGLMMGLLFSICGFFAMGFFHGVKYPSYVWNLPLGTVIFIVAIIEIQNERHLVIGFSMFTESAHFTCCFFRSTSGVELKGVGL